MLSVIPLSTTISRYLAGRFILSVLMVFGTCVSLITLVDFVEMLRRTGDIPGVTVLTVAYMILLRLPAFTEQLFPFAVLFGTMAALLRLSQKLELVVVRAAGVSVWQFIAPGLFVAMGIGVFGTFVYNPVAAQLKGIADGMENRIFGRNQGIGSGGNGIWIRQDGADGQFIMSAQGAAQQGKELSGITIHTFDQGGRFIERFAASRAVLYPGYWELHDVSIAAPGADPDTYTIFLLSTNLTIDQVRESFSNVETISFYDLPKYIELSEQAGLPAIRLRLQYQTLLARPWLLAAMVLIAATVSLRLFRLGNVMPMILGGVAAGFLLYVAMEVAKQVGRSGVVNDVAAAWVPVVVAMLTGLTILLHQEDG